MSDAVNLFSVPNGRIKEENEGNYGSVHRPDLEDKEFFLGKVFESDPKKGYELLFKQYYQTMCNHAVRYVYSKEIAQDIVSEIFLVIWQNKIHTRITSSYRAYLFTAVRNKCLKHIAKEFGKIDSNATDKEIDSINDPDTPQQIMQFNELNIKIENAIQGLAPQCQKVFLLSRFEGKKYQEIADTLGLSIKTIEAHISRALDSLRKVLGD